MHQFLCVLVLLSSSVILAQPSWGIKQCPEPFTWNNVASVTNFMLANGNGRPVQQTTVQVCYTSSGFNYRMIAVDSNIQSTYYGCNEPVFYADAMEAFIALGSGEPYSRIYYELDMGPNDAFFGASVYNPNGVCSGIQDTLLACNDTGIKASSGLVSGGWALEVFVPWTLWNITFSEAKEAPWRMNFFRIDTPSNGQKEYSCWSSTFTNPPCFHVPKYFGFISLN